MREIDRIAKQLERTYSGDAWHGPSLRKVLEGIGESEAKARPIPDAHSIAEIAAVLAWREEAVRRLAGKGGDVPVRGDWPEALGWTELLDALDRSQNALTEKVFELDEAILEEKVEGRRESHYVLLQGIIHHDLYHAGQIAILKKVLSGPSPKDA